MIKWDQAVVEELGCFKIDIAEHIIEDLGNDSNLDFEEGLKWLNVLLPCFSNVGEVFEFNHPVDINLNTINQLYNQLDKGLKVFPEVAAETAKFYLSIANHAKIGSGKFIITKLRSIQFEQNYHSGLAIFKIDGATDFIDLHAEYTPQLIKGISKKNIDKSAIIIDTEKGVKVLSYEKTSKQSEYWITDFLKVKSSNDDVGLTNSILKATKDFIASSEVITEAADRADALNKTLNYFKSNTEFNMDEFQDEVFEDMPEAKPHFKEIGDQFVAEGDDDFAISKNAVKKQARAFKSVLKLDKNFHVYIHGDRKKIEQGVEPDGRKFYKIYFDEEL